MEMDRRNFLKVLAGSLMALWSMVLVYPVFRYLKRPPEEVAEVSEVVVAEKDELSPGQSKTFKFGEKPGLLVRKASGEYLAFDATCTHLACIVQHRPEKKDIFCACHGGIYGEDGTNVSGPPPKPLRPLKVVTADSGQVIVRKA